MPRKDFIDIEIEGDDDIRRAIARMDNRREAGLRELVNDLANGAAFSVIAHAPYHTGYYMSHIDRDGPQWFPGGAGGGGEWKAIVGVKAGTSMHPLYVEFGTGLYRSRGRRGLIWAAAGPGKLTGKRTPVMAFEKRGEPPIFRHWLRGMQPRRYFYQSWLTFLIAARAIMAREKLID